MQDDVRCMFHVKVQETICQDGCIYDDIAMELQMICDYFLMSDSFALLHY